MISVLSKKQRQLVRLGSSDYKLILAGGAIRSGKTFSAVVSFCLWLIKHHDYRDMALIGNSIESAMRNCGNDIISFFQSIGIPAVFSRSLGTRIIVSIGEIDINIWLVGAADERAQRRLQGSTLKGIMFDEIALVGEQVFYSAFSRLSLPGSKLFGTYNPESPRHWLKIKVIDRIDDWNGINLQFDMDDNPVLTDEVKNQFRNSFTGHFKKRMINGLWAGASGVIFPDYETTNETPEWPLTFSLDWGVSSVFAALAFATNGKQSVCVSELYYDATGGHSRNEIEHLDAFTGWTRALGASGGLIWLDPNTPQSFKRLLQSRGFRSRNADNDVLAGLTTTATKLATGDIKINVKCRNLLDEIAGYQWDDKAVEIGVDAPIKINDHAVDALRYYAFNSGNVGIHAFSLKSSKNIGF